MRQVGGRHREQRPAGRARLLKLRSIPLDSGKTIGSTARSSTLMVHDRRGLMVRSGARGISRVGADCALCARLRAESDSGFGPIQGIGTGRAGKNGFPARFFSLTLLAIYW